MHVTLINILLVDVESALDRMRLHAQLNGPDDAYEQTQSSDRRLKTG